MNELAAPILIASDLSSRSDRPLERALRLAEERSSRLILLHVIDADGEGGPERERQARRLISADLGSRAAELEIEIAHGSVPNTIADVAGARRCALIVTGVARFNSPLDFVLGTAVDFLVRHASMPVLVVKRRPQAPYRRLLAATDFSGCSRAALEAAAALFPEAEFRLLHASHAAYEAWLDKAATTEAIAEEAEREMQLFVEALPDALRARIETKIEIGELSDAVEHGIGEGGCDLLVLGTHGRGGFAHATIGSRAAELLVSASSDVLMVRSRG